MTMPAREVCDRARQTKDARFDGLFFTGVRSTRIFCRPVCPAPTPKPQNIIYFPSAAAATMAGYRPCLRCRPELSPDTRPDDETVRRALLLIAEGWLEDGSVETLAAYLGSSVRRLRRLFADKAGASPLAVHQARRLLLAKQLLAETSLPVTQVALAAGFASVRRFNAAFKARCGVVPSAVRRSSAQPLPDDEIRLRLAYRPPLDFDHMLEAMRSQAVPGIERVTTGAYERNVATGRHAAWIRITHEPGKPELLLRASGVPPERIQPLVRCVRRMFDLDADLQAAHAVLVQDPRLADAIRARPGVRIAGAWDGFEAAVAVSLRAHDSASDAASQLRGIVDRHGATVDANPPGLDRAFPSAAQLAVADLERTVGLSPLSAHTLRRLAAAVRDGRLGFGRGQQLDEFVDGFSACTSLPLRAAHEVALRALGDPNAWPVAGADDCLAWQPWRAYAAVHRSEAVATPDAVSCPA